MLYIVIIIGGGDMNEVKALEAVDTALANLEPEERARVLAWAQAKFGASANANQNHSPTATQTVEDKPAYKANGGGKVKASKKSKSIIGMDKSLNLSPDGKISAADFGAAKSPTNAINKCVVAVYYLRETLELEKVTVQAVFTYFKVAGWPIPTDLKNTLQQAGTSGYLHSADSMDIKLTSMGENLVEHELPAKAKTK